MKYIYGAEKTRLIFSLLILLALFTACQTKQEGERIISVTIEPQRYFAEKIAGNKFKIQTVVPEGQSPETYDPTPQQMVLIGNSEAYFQIGPIGFELVWMDNIKENNSSVKFFDLSEGVNFIENADHHHAEGEECDHAHHHHGLQDPHIWSSISGAKTIVRNMLNAFIALDKENMDYYQANYDKLIKEIDTTGEEILQLLKPVLSRAFIIYHPALTYFAAEYNLQQLCIEMDGKEPSPAQLKELVDTARFHNARIIFVQAEFDQKNAELIAKETGCRLVWINPLSYNWSKEMLHIAKALADE